MDQSFTFIDVSGNQAQYTVSEKDGRNEFRWSTDHGDYGSASTFAEAQYNARTMLKSSMTADRRTADAAQTAKYASRWR